MLTERATLVHAEPMLLIDDGEAEPPEAHPLLDERVGADRQAGGVRGEGRGGRTARRGPLAPGHQHGGDPERGEERGDRARMLLREQLGRGHERDLKPVLHRDERGADGDDRLPGADVALQ